MSGGTALSSRALWGNAASLALLVLIATGFFTLQSGDWWPAMPRADRWIGAAIALSAYFLFCAGLLWRSRVRRTSDDTSSTAGGNSSVLVVYASQTGFAQQLAERSAENLRGTGLAVKLRAIGEVDSAMLANAGRALFVASTTGEGDPPDQALAFVRGAMAQPAALQDLRYAVLALGDREYEHFCGFGHQLDRWLRQHGAQSLFDIVEVDNRSEEHIVGRNTY